MRWVSEFESPWKRNDELSQKLNQEKVGIILQILPRELYRVSCEDGTQVVAGVPIQTRRHSVRFIQGDKVRVSVSTMDIGRARILGRE
jgi:translation initiation factor IF-1